MRILAQYQKAVHFFAVTEPTKIYKLAKQCWEPCSSRTLCSITRHLQFLHSVQKWYFIASDWESHLPYILSLLKLKAAAQHGNILWLSLYFLC